MRNIILRLLLVVSVLGLIGVTLFLIYVYPFMKEMKKVTTIKYDPQLTIVLGGGGNSGILVSDSVVLLIDTKMNDAADSLYKTVKALAGNKPIIVVNTHIHGDHTGGNKYYKGQTIVAGGNYDRALWEKDCGKEGVPTVWLKDSMILKVGDETVTIFNLPWNAHTQSDVLVYLSNRKMLFSGDVILNKQVPAIFAGYNADGYGYLRALDYLPQRFDIDKVVPGHGDMGGIEVINTFKGFFVDMKLAAQDPAKKKELIAKYKDWKQVPIAMSPGAVVDFFEDHKADK